MYSVPIRFERIASETGAPTIQFRLWALGTIPAAVSVKKKRVTYNFRTRLRTFLPVRIVTSV